MDKSDLAFRATSQTGPANALALVVPSDSADLAGGVARSLFVGTAGMIEVIDPRGSQVRIVSGARQYHPIRVRRVLSTGTTATDIVALY